MKNRKFIWSALLVSIILMSCSENDNIVEQNTPEDTVTTDGFKILAATDFTSELGEIAEDASTETRTPAAVDANGRPTEQYMLNYVNVLKVDREQPTTEDIEKFGTLSYVTGSQKFVKHEFGTGGYEVEYNIVFDDTQYNGCTKKGTVTLKYQDTEEISLTLTVFETSKLEQKYITINDFPYDKTDSPRGSSLYYLTYDPQENDGIITLPTLGNNMITTIVGTGSDGELHYEQDDNLFVSNELIFCADDTKLYVYEIVEAEGDYGGYRKIREYDLKTTTIQRTVLNMSRLTSMISASFMLVDDAEGVYDAKTSYFDGNLESSAAKFKETFKTDIDLTTIKCPYATADGMNTIFNINDGIVSAPGRLLLWGDGYSIVGNDDTSYGYDDGNVVENASVNLLYSFPVEVGEPLKVARGIGIKGMSYCAVYRGVENDTRHQPISFYITVNDGDVSKKIKITGFTRNGYPMPANKATHIIMLIPAQNFVNYVESVGATVTGASNTLSRTGDNGFSEFVVPSENVFVK